MFPAYTLCASLPFTLPTGRALCVYAMDPPPCSFCLADNDTLIFIQGNLLDVDYRKYMLHVSAYQHCYDRRTRKHTL